MKFSKLLVLLLCASAVLQAADVEGRPASVIRNDKLELTILVQGAEFANLSRIGDASGLSPFFNAARAFRLQGLPVPERLGSIGHFMALDTFGAPSDEEKAAGIPSHGEANKQNFELLQTGKQGSTSILKLSAKLPLVQEAVTRTIRMVDGESVVYVNTEVESALSVDRPVSWAEHATLGLPYVTADTVLVIPATNCRVHPQRPGAPDGQLAGGKDFKWPDAPLSKGGTVNLGVGPASGTLLGLATCQIDPARTYGYATALRKDQHVIFGYVFPREEYPWLINWMNYTGTPNAARAFELATQPFDISHRKAVDLHEMFGTPTYKWLPAKSKIHSNFLFFYTQVPDDFQSVADVTFQNRKIQIRDRSGKTVTLAANLPLE